MTSRGIAQSARLKMMPLPVYATFVVRVASLGGGSDANSDNDNGSSGSSEKSRESFLSLMS